MNESSSRLLVEGKMKSTVSLVVTLSLVGGFWLVFGLRAAAQEQSAATLAIDGAVLGEFDSRDDRLPSSAFGAGFNLVAFVSPRISIGAEVDLPTTRAYEGTIRTTHPDGTSEVSFRRDTFRGPMISATVGFHFRTGTRVSVAFVTGISIEHRIFGADVYHDTLDASGAVTQHVIIDTSGPPNSGTFEWLQVPVGFDVALPLTPHLSLVPQIRTYLDPFAGLNGCCGGLHSKLRTAIRWSF
jgi:hypothetical protein